MLLIWGLPYGIAGLYDFLQGQEIAFTQYPTIGSLLPAWLPQAWPIVGIFLLLIIAFEGAYRISHKRLKCNLEAHPITGKRASYESIPYTAWAELKVTNTNPDETLEDVKVQIVELSQVYEEQDKQGSYFLHEPYPRWTPSNVYWSERNAPPNQFSLPIAPGESSYALIAVHLDSGPALGKFNTPTRAPMLESKIVIEVSSKNSGILRKAYYIEYRPPHSDEFEFMEWDLWCKSHNVNEQLIHDKEGSQT